jgi:hypothetical protein
MQDAGYGLRRIPLPRTPVNWARRRRRAGVIVENKDSRPPFGQDESLLY